MLKKRRNSLPVLKKTDKNGNTTFRLENPDERDVKIFTKSIRYSENAAMVALLFDNLPVIFYIFPWMTVLSCASAALTMLSSYGDGAS
jgi:hypothetical protein